MFQLVSFIGWGEGGGGGGGGRCSTTVQNKLLVKAPFEYLKQKVGSNVRSSRRNKSKEQTSGAPSYFYLFSIHTEKPLLPHPSREKRAPSLLHLHGQTFVQLESGDDPRQTPDEEAALRHPLPELIGAGGRGGGKGGQTSTIIDAKRRHAVARKNNKMNMYSCSLVHLELNEQANEPRKQSLMDPHVGGCLFKSEKVLTTTNPLARRDARPR